MTRLILISLSILVAGLIACGKQQKSDTKIDSGIFITGDLENTVPGVMWIGNCTSTAVSHNTLITAAHCVENGGQLQDEVCIRSGQIANGTCSSNVFVPDAYLQRQFMPNDVAVVVFPDNTFSRYFEMASQRISVRDDVLLVGYSSDNRGDAAAEKGSKRWGRNTVRSVNGDGRTTIITGYGSSSSAVAVSPGDSGGPMFSKDCKLVGVASRMSTGGQKSSLHTNILGDNSIFMRQMQNRGAYYCGLTGNDASKCPATGRASVDANPGSSAEGPDFPCAPTSAPGGSGGTEEADVFFAINPDASGATRFFVSSDTEMDSVRICRGLTSECSNSDWQVRFKTQKGDRYYYETSDQVNLAVLASSSLPLTIAGTKGGETVANVQIRVESN